MDLLLLQNTPAMGGANTANRALLAGMVDRGHRCTLVTPAFGRDEERDPQRLLARLAERNCEVVSVDDDEVLYRDRGVSVHAVFDGAYGPERNRHLIDAHAPTWILVSEEDMALPMLGTSLEACQERVVFLSHTPLMLPFGPDSFVDNAERTERLRRVAGVVVPSFYLRDYFTQYAGIPATTIRFPVYAHLRPSGGGHSPRLDDFKHGEVMMVNPCSFKGIDIFLALAKAFPEVEFGAVPTWGTSTAERRRLASCPNVHVRQPVANIADLLRHSKVLLAPSLWGEAFGQIAVEAMLHGIPTLASDSGGLPEAKLGVDYVLPVRRVERYHRRFDERMLPIPVVPEQDIDPWARTLRNLLEDSQHYGRLATDSHTAANTFVATVQREGASSFEEYLVGLGDPEPRDGNSESMPPTNLRPLRTRREILRGWLG